MSLLSNVCRNRNYLRKTIPYSRCIGKYFTSVATNENNSPQTTIKIPKRIERGPTDILRALADTVSKDYTAPHYRYHDDPYLTPAGSYHKRAYALSIDSGRRAARYFFNTYPELFYRDEAEPKIEAFSYPDVFDENTPVDETDLKKCIIRSEVSNAITVYNNLKREGIDISNDTLHELLELTCFYNGEDPLNDDYSNEKWLSNYVKDSTKMWNEQAFAEQLFNSIEEKTSQTYCAIILGMAKYNHAERAYNYYQTMREKHLKCNVETYNSLLRVVSYLRDSSETRWELISDLLRSMSRDQIMPNLGTLNSILEQLAKMKGWKLSRTMAKRTLVEMVKNLGITPCLATYKHLLNLYCRDKGSTSTILYEIMDDIEDQEFEARDVKDILFFVKAMDISCNHVGDVQLAHRVHNLLCKGKNDKFMTLFVMESAYYNYLFQILCFAENIDKLMDFYKKYVPNVHVPNPELCANILESIDLNGAFHYIPQLWNDIKFYNLYGNQGLFDKFIIVLSKTKFSDELQQQFVSIASVILERGIELVRENAPNFDFTGRTLANFIITFLNGGEIDKAYEVIQILDKEHYKIIGYPDAEPMTMFCKFAIDAKQYEYALHAIRYCNLFDMPDIAKYALDYCNSIKLDEIIKDKFEKLNAINLTKEKMNSSVEEGSESKPEGFDEQTNERET